MELEQSGVSSASTTKPKGKLSTAVLAAVGSLCLVSGLCVASAAMLCGEPARDEVASQVAPSPPVAAPPPPVAAPPPPPVAAPSPPPATVQALEFPGEVQRFHRLNELQQETYAATFGGNVLSGTGQIFSVENCGLLDDSARWGRDCIKVVVDTDTERAALYYSSDRRAEIAALSEGQRHSFANCTTVSIRNWGFWSTATCDMP